MSIFARKNTPENMRIKLQLFLMAFLLIFNTISHAQVGLDTVTVMSEPGFSGLDRSGRYITVIPQRTLEKMNHTSLYDALQYVSGIEVKSRGGFGVQGDITLRGSTYNQVLILVDGMRLNDPLTGHFNGFIPVAQAEIDRIEVLRGAASSVYGPDAVGGVINIITKKFANNNEPTLTNQGDFFLGDNQLVYSNHGLHWNNDRFFVNGGVQLNTSLGDPVPERRLETDTLESYRNNFDVKTVGLSAGYRLGNSWTASFRTSYDDRDFNARYFYTTSPFDQSTERTRNWFNYLLLQNEKGGNRTRIKLSYRYGTDLFVFNPSFPSTNEHTTNFYNVEINRNSVLNENWSLYTGLQTDLRKIESTDRGNHEDAHIGLSGLLNYAKNAWNIKFGTRADYDQNYDLEFSPQLDVSYRMNKFLFRALSGRSIRSADYTERYVSHNLPHLTSGRSLGNPSLNAESAWNYELGVDYTPKDFLYFRATAFLRSSDELIDYVLRDYDDIEFKDNLDPEGEYFFAQNVGKVNTQGLELEARLAHDWKANRISLGTTFTLLDTESDDDVVSVYLASHSKYLLTNNLLFEGKHINISINTIFKQRNELTAPSLGDVLDENFSTVNASIGWKFSSGITAQIRCFNVFDKENQDILGAQLPGRWMMYGMSYRLEN